MPDRTEYAALMIAERTLPVLALLVAVQGCMPSDTPAADASANPTIMFQPFTSKTWSLSIMNGEAQLSITDGGGPAACALSEDQRRSLGTAGVQIIAHLPGMVTETCPAGHGGFTLTECAAPLGSSAYVPAGCAFYRQWDAQGASVGVAVAINGVISFSGDATSCYIIANIGFLGADFNEQFTLMNGPTAQPWCRES
jgi:hypothetical protein